jgi:hypothetical protein
MIDPGDTMTRKERMLTALRRQVPDRVPAARTRPRWSRPG